ncbi:MAG: hypothetical protein Fur0022_14210 [Anaerolineales bacterium]
MNTNLIGRYIHAVGQQLPEKMREDVQMELRSLLADSLEARVASAKAVGRVADEDLIVEVLRDFGAPKEVAARYAPIQKPLIEPALTPIMNLIILLNLFFIWGYATYSLGSPALEGDATLLVRDAVLNAVTSTIASLLIIGIVFFVMSRVVATYTIEWNPRALPPIESPDRPNHSALIGQVIGIFIVLILLNFFPNWVGAPYLIEGRWQFVPYLAPTFSVHLPWLNLFGILTLALNGIVLRKGRWTPTLRWVEFGVSGVAAVVLYRLLVADLLTHLPALNEFLKGMFLVMLGCVIVELGVMFYRLVKRPNKVQPVFGATILSK